MSFRGGGGNCFCGERKCEKHPGGRLNLLVFEGKFQTLGGKFPPLKALKKTLKRGPGSGPREARYAVIAATGHRLLYVHPRKMATLS